MKKKTSIFKKHELEKLPLTYRQMDVSKTDDVGELYKKSIFSSSYKHFSKQYKVYVSDKPISNYIIRD